MRLPPSSTLLAWLADPTPSAATAAATQTPKHPWLDWWKGLPGRVLFENWEGGVFERSFWESCMHGFWVSLALGVAALLVLELWVPQFGARVPQRVIRRTSIGLTIVGFFAYFSFFNPNVRSKDFYNPSEFFPAYMGSKYAAELGYTRLYECTAVAEVELGKGAGIRTKSMRDLSEGSGLIAIASGQALDAPERCKEHFSSERWEAFRSDISWFEASTRGPVWERMKLDYGYNAPPVWSMMGRFFASFVPASGTSLKWLAALDVALHVGALALLVWGFGWRSAALASVFWACNAAGNYASTGGGFLRLDWLFLLVASMACARRGKFLASGAAVTAAALLRVVPLFGILGYGIILLSYWLRHRRLTPAHRRFLAGCGLALAVLVPASALTIGADSYQEFADVALYRETQLTNEMGLPVILAQEWSGRLRFSRDEGIGDAAVEEWREGRIERVDGRAWLSLTLTVGLGLWVAWVLARTRSFWLAIPLSIPVLFAASHQPCATYLVFIAMAPLVLLRRSWGPVLLVLAALSQVLLERLFWVDDRYTALSYLFGTASLLCLWAFSRRPTAAGVSALVQPRAQAPVKS